MENVNNPHATNSLLDVDNENKKNHYLKILPSILINKRTYYGNLNAENIFEAVCAAHAKKPEICYDKGAFNRKNHTFMTIVIIILVIFINLVLFILCRKYFNRKINQGIENTNVINIKVDSAVTNYISLKEQK